MYLSVFIRVIRGGRFGKSNLQVLFHDFIGEAGNGAGDDDYAAVHRVEAVGDFAAEIDILLHEQDREGMLLLELLHGIFYLGHVASGLLKGGSGGAGCLQCLQRVAD